MRRDIYIGSVKVCGFVRKWLWDSGDNKPTKTILIKQMIVTTV